MASSTPVFDTAEPRVATPEPRAPRAQRSLASDAWRQFRRHQLAVGGLVTLVIITVATVVGPFVYSASPTAMDPLNALAAPSLEHPLGTDDLGRDLLARELVGGRVSVAVGLVAMLIAVTVGTLIGATAGYSGSWLEGVLMRLTDLFLALPTLPLLLMTIYLFRDELRRRLGPELGIFLLIVTLIGLLNWMPVARLVRASFLSLKEQEFVQAARCIGARDSSIMLGHILPNVAGPITVAATVGVGAAIIAESSLSFLGLGFPPDVPTWGRLLFDAKNYLQIAPYWALSAGGLIFLTVLSINYIGDGLRDALDPRGGD